jgi:multiple sugar transport system substrate-binding protein
MKTLVKMECVMFCILALVTTDLFAGGGKQSGRTELNFMEVMTSPDRTKVLQDLIASYEALHPEVKINLISPPYDQARNRLAMSLAANEALDIVEVHSELEPQLVNNKNLEDLSPYLARWDEASTLLQAVKDAANAVGGKPYYVPSFLYGKALFIRTDILSKLGAPQNPSTLDELYAASKKVTNGTTQYGFTLRGKTSMHHLDLLLVSDIKNIDPANIYKLKDGSSVFDQPEYLAALKKYVDLYKTACPPDSINWGFNEQINSFVSGITPYLIQDPDTIPLVDTQLSREQNTVIPMPVGASGTIYLNLSPVGLGIPSYSKNKDAAWDFISYLLSNRQNSEFNKKYGTIPIHTTAFTDDPHFSTGLYQAWAVTLNTPGRFTFVDWPLNDPRYPGWAQVLDQYTQSTLLGTTTPEQAVKAWSEYWK